MNKKEELEHKIKIYEQARQLAEEHLNEANLQLRDLCEAEKPKLRHGDFGMWDFGEKGHLVPAIYLDVPSSDGAKDSVFYAYESKGTGGSWCSDATENGKLTIFGNIFDLMECWGKEFKGWNNDMEASGI